MANVTAFVLSPEIAGAVDGVTIPGVPGLWFHDRPVLPAALEYSLEEMRDTIVFLGLPLVEVKVAERAAYESFPESPHRLASSRELPRGIGEGDAPEADAIAEPDPTVLDETVERALDAGEAEES